MDEDQEDLRGFLALLTSAQGACARLHSNSRFPPIRVTLRLKIDAATRADLSVRPDAARLQIFDAPSRCWPWPSWPPRRRGPSGADGRPREDVAVAEIRSVVLGRETAAFVRTRRYLRGTSEPALDLEDLEVRCFSIIVGDATRSIDLEVPLSKGGEARRNRLAHGLASLAGMGVSLQAPASLAAATHQRGLTERLHAIVFGRPVAVLLALCIFLSGTAMACLSPLFDVDAELASRYAREINLAESVNTVVSWVFTFEVAAKIVALESLTFYVSDPWNALDFFVVTAGWLGDGLAMITPGQSSDSALNFSALRALRALRVLRTFKMLEGVREIVDTFIKTLVAVAQGMVLYFYFIGISAIFAYEIWRIELIATCALPDGTSLEPVTYCKLDGDPDACPGTSKCTEIDAQPQGRGFHAFPAALNMLYTISVRAGLGQYLRGLLLVSDAPASSVLILVFFILFNLFVSGMVFSIFIAIIRHTFTATRQQTAERKRRLHLKRIRDSAVVAPLNMSATARVSRRMTRVRRSLVEEITKPSPPQRPLVAFFGRIAHSPKFEGAVSVLILLNCISFALDYHGQSSEEKERLRTAELCFTSLFIVELIIKVLGLGGARPYLKSAWNVFDLVVVTSSVVGIFATSFVNLSLLRLLRLLRVVRLLRRSPDIVRILTALLRSFPQLANLVLFCGLVFSVFGIMGMQLYGAKLGLPTQADLEAANGNFAAVYSPPRAHFDTFPMALLTLFQMMTGGAQWTVYYNILGSSMGPTAPFFFLIFGVFSTFIILNFMVVIIMSNFALSADALQQLRLEKEEIALRAIAHKERHAKHARGRVDKVRQDSASSGDKDSSQSETDDRGMLGGDFDPMVLAKKLWCGRCVPNSRHGHAFLLLPPRAPVRVLMQRVSEHAWFKGFVILAVVLSSISLTLESPSAQSSPSLMLLLEVADKVFLAIFTFEFVAKVLAYGLLLPADSYLRSGWNCLDFVVLIVSYAGLAGGGGSMSRLLRTGRILRPLRMINRNEGLKIIVDALLRAARPVSYTLVLLLVYFFSFGLIGMETFMGLFWRCTDASMPDRASCVGHYVDADTGILRPRVWTQPAFSFDSIGASFATLIETISLKGWPEKLYVAIDTTAVDMQPRRDAAPSHALFFVVFIYFGSFFMMKLFVGIIVGTFRKYSGTLLLTPDQLEWLEMKRAMAHIAPALKEPEGAIRAWFWRAHVSGRLNLACAVILLAHLGYVLVCEAARPTDASSWTETAGHVVLLATAGGLHMAQISCAGFTNVVSRRAYNVRTGKLYRRLHGSNLFSLLGCLGCAVALVPGSQIPIRLMVSVRGLDFTRVALVVGPASVTMRHVLRVLAECMLLMLNVTLVFFMVLFIYAVLGMQLFAEVRSGAVLGVTASFASFPEALLTMFLIAAGDNWITIMRECGVEAPDCEEGVDCGSLASSRAFFYSFFFVCFGVFLNLYTATIVDAYESKLKAQTTRWAFTEGQLLRFRAVWADFDPHGTGRISVRLFRDLFFKLGVPFVFGAGEKFSARQKRVQYNQARLEMMDCILDTLRCALPDGGISETGEPSVSFFEVLQVVVMINVDAASLSTVERVHRQQKQRLITRALSALSIQAWFHGIMHRRILRAMLHAAASEQRADARPLAANLQARAVRQSYAVLYSRQLPAKHPLLSVLQVSKARDEVNVQRIRTMMATSRGAGSSADDFGGEETSLEALIEEDETEQQIGRLPRRRSLQVDSFLAATRSARELQVAAREAREGFTKNKAGTC